MKVSKPVFPLLLGSLALSLTLSGCGMKLDMSLISKSIGDDVASQLGLADAVVTCPQEAPPVKAGETFECEAKPKEGGRLVLKVTQKDDKGNVGWELVKIEGMVNLRAIEESITTGLKEQIEGGVTVSCGEEGGSSLRVSQVGETFECQAHAENGSSRAVVVTVKDNEGNVSWALAQPAEEATEEATEEPAEDSAQE